MKVNIVVLNYNGKALLKECLPSIIEAATKSRYNPKVTVLDNESADDSLYFLRSNFPQVDIFNAKENKVYCSYNEFFKQSDDDIIIILNSDIKADPGFVDPLVRCFEKDTSLLFVSSKMYFFDGVTYQGDRSKALRRFGIISANTRYPGYEGYIDESGHAFSTGNGAFDRRKFLKLEGFDEIYLPGRYEDVDLCFRAWKSGYKGMYEPESVVYHKGYGSFKEEFTDRQIQKMVFKNSLIFMWKNITDFKILLIMHLWLIPRFLFFMITIRCFFIKAFFEALANLPKIIKRRRSVLRGFRLSDREILRRIG